MKRKAAFYVWLIALLLIPTYVFSWGSATHAYFANKLGSSRKYLNLQEIYGAMVPDMFNLSFDSLYFDYLQGQTHEEFDKVASRAGTKGLKAFAYGFTSHNDVWGADYTAHHEGRTTPGIGYVFAQVEALKAAFEDSLEQMLLDSKVDSARAKELAAKYASSIAHITVETAVDLLIRRNEDSKIGRRILLAARLRSPAVPALLVSAYAADFSREFDMSYLKASGIIIAAEKGFREYVSYYGYVFTKKESKIIRLLSLYGAKLFQAYLKLSHKLNVTVPSTTLANLLRLAIARVEPSYHAEVTATLSYLRNEMPLHQGKSHPQPLAYRAESENTGIPVPQEFALSQNHPNPFNPITTIHYSLAKDSRVRITVYNTLGQLVAVLVDGYQSEGSHSVTWNAQQQPAGFYIYRLEAKDFVQSKKMLLQK